LIRDPQAEIEARKGTPASSAEIERITDTLLVALRASEYPKLNTSKSFHAAVRRVIRRLHMEQGDAEFLLGMLRQMVWKMKTDERRRDEGRKDEKKTDESKTEEIQN
jgi:tRNA C32,U32 (ribose-2'-O)-methylase TrmJ